ncbi:hypothetical protein [Rhodovarius lipocyclicus]|uniref:hypothetical protein n=1 Tax=Rhodovarius lipocyclicus TaxID=268410 RepID=UPI00135C2B73|nr:hypothetical protein [Rhodovarius lipocyclicus]
MSTLVAPKSDQLNADDLQAGPRTVVITAVKGNANAEQPVSIYFEGDNGRPFKPCKSMRRVLLAAWGAQASEYPGRAMTLYRDPTVTYGGFETGGIRISHMSHIERDMNVVLTATKTKRVPYKVQVLKPAAPKQAAGVDPAVAAQNTADDMVARVKAAATLADLKALTAHQGFVARQEKLRTGYPELAEKVAAAINDAIAFLDDGFPAPATGAQGEG